ncbi:MAG: acyl-CoA thioesterase [Gammaproteobacteria bacterium]|nr:acyl-CoA thioesterase [Gammaproteobacteria bacterium]
MNLYLRFLLLMLKRIRVSRKIGVFDQCRTRFRVQPLDLDLNFHMNNSRYLSIMDLGRFDLMMRSGVFWKLMAGGYYPVVVSESIRFRKSLKLFDGFELFTAIESWDDKDVFMTQRFVHRGEAVATGFIKGRFRKRGRKSSVPTAELFEITGTPYHGPRLSALARSQKTVEANLRAVK